jgi:nitrite reductase (NADH) small subunit
VGVRHRVGRLEDLPEDRGTLVEVDGREIALFRRGDEVFALDNACPHRGAALAFGEVRGDVVYCPVHAWPFQLSTGRCTEYRDAAVDRYRVTVEGGEIYLER